MKTLISVLAMLAIVSTATAETFVAPIGSERVQVTGTVEAQIFFCAQVVGNTCPDPVVSLLTEDGSFEIVGPRAGDLLAFDGLEVTVAGLSFWPIQVPEHRSLTVSGFLPGVVEQDILTGRVERDGEQVLLNVDGLPVRIAAGVASGLLARAEGSEVSVAGTFVDRFVFLPTQTRFMVKGEVMTLPIPLCFPGEPCGPFSTHLVTLENDTLELLAPAFYPMDVDQFDRWVEIDYVADHEIPFHGVSVSVPVFELSL